VESSACAQVRGYFYSRPLAVRDIAALLYGFQKERKRA
jgi:hypothetical protein